MASQWSNFLFDFDGTLVDSSELHAEAFRIALTEYRPDLVDGFDYAEVKGMPTSIGFRRIGVKDPCEVEVLSLEKQRRFRGAADSGRLELLPGAHGLLEALVEDGRRLFLVTSGSRGSVEPALAVCGLRNVFEGIVAADDVDQGKPSPEPYLTCLDRFGLDQSTSIAIEDSESGVTSAKGCGLVVVGVHDGGLKGQVEEFFPNLDGLRDWVMASAVRSAQLA